MIYSLSALNIKYCISENCLILATFESDTLENMAFVFISRFLTITIYQRLILLQLLVCNF